GPFFPHQTVTVYVRARNMCATSLVHSVAKTMPAAPVGCLKRLTGIESNDTEQAEVNVFPNPANDVLNIKLPITQEKMLIRMINMEGQILKNISTTDSQLNWDIIEVPTGLYIITINSSTFNIVKKVQIIR
ncbi:MAG TPA: T9SS type A sorting domain-containing protein, partial [Nitrosopumilaceae archaeon]|nr:T9SS type A sorting domain-containing protein [Nitrosopumilaceae archaeon]